MDTHLERRTLALHIRLLEDLLSATTCHLCDSGTGSCQIHRTALAAAPALQTCLSILRHHRTSLRRFPRDPEPVPADAAAKCEQKKSRDCHSGSRIGPQ